MKQVIKQRIVGGSVLLALAAIVLPIFFEHPIDVNIADADIPTKPVMPTPPAYVKDVAPEAKPLPDLAVLPEEKPTKLEQPEDKPQLDSQEMPVAWTLQVATFGNRDNAERLMKTLQEKGNRAYMRTIKQDDGKHLSKVYVGPLVQRKELEKVQQTLAAELNLHGLITRYSP